MGDYIMKLSIIMSVYIKENPDSFSKCLLSLSGQTVLPDELIIIKDGPLTNELERVISEFKCPFDLQIIALPENITQGPARAKGLLATRNEWVAIMDSDDICRPDRFEKQIEMVAKNPELGLIGGQISEFRDDPNHVIAVRAVPLEHDAIIEFAKGRNPFNSMTVMLRRDIAIKAGNYEYFPMFEDYDLWVRMIKNGAICANHPDVLVDARVGSGMYERRRGMPYVRAEVKMQKVLLGLGLISNGRFAKNIALRAPIRLLPGKLVAKMYNVFVRG